MSQSQLPKRSNIYDDHHHLHPEKLHKYRNADLLDLNSFNKSTKSSVEKLQTSSVPSIPKLSTQDLFTAKAWTFNIPDLDQSVLTPIKIQNVQMEHSTAITQFPATEASLNRKAALSSVSDTHEQQVPYRLSTIFEEESPLQESMANVENNEVKEKEEEMKEEVKGIVEEVKDTADTLLDGIKEFPPINLKDIKLDTSINFQFKKIDFPLVASLKTSEEESLKVVPDQQEEESAKKDEEIVHDYLEKIQEIIPYDYTEPKSDKNEEPIPEVLEEHVPEDPIPEVHTEVNIAAPVPIKVDTEDRGVDTCDFMTVEKAEEGVQVGPVLVDKVVDTAELIFEEEKEDVIEKEEKEEVIKEDKVVDTSQLITMQDEFTDTIELVDDERQRSIEEVKKLKFKFLGELHGLRNRLDIIKQDQTDSKQGTSESIKETIQSVTEFVRAGLEKYIKEKSKKQIKNLRAYQIEVSQTKNELEKLKSFVQFTAEEMKKKIAAYFNTEGNNLLEKLIDDSGKEKIRQLGLSKLGEMLGDGNSVTTDSGYVTPSKATPSKPRQSRGPRRHKLDPAVIDGLIYLFDHDALKNTVGDERAFREKLRKILKTNEVNKPTSEFLLGTLLDRSTRKREKSKSRSRSRAPSESGDKKRRKSFHEDDGDDDDDMSDFKSITGRSTPGKGSRRKEAKRDLMSYESFKDENGDKVFVVKEEIENEQNE